jgi:hypothetical protein
MRDRAIAVEPNKTQLARLEREGSPACASIAEMPLSGTEEIRRACW